MPDNFSDEPSGYNPRASAAPAVQPSIPNPQPPLIPDHELLKKIGAGSYGEVWLARSAVGTLRAVKIVWRKTFWSDHPFEREFKGIQKFEPISREHEGLVDILQIGRGDGYFYYVMELADGEEMQNEEGKMKNDGASNPTASNRQKSILNSEFYILNYRPKTLDNLRRPISQLPTLNPQPAVRRLPVAECVRIGLTLTSALAHLHRHKLVHRDVKPANVIFVGGAPKLADIGLVTETSEARSYVGTEGFIPPEGPGTPQADLYSLGKLLYEISTGKDRHAFPELPSDLAEQSEAEQLVELNAILLKACQNDVNQRYRSAEEMHIELALLQKGKSVRQKRTSEQRWAVGKTVGLALIILAVVVAGAASLRRQFTRSEYAGEGPPSTNDLATALCEKAMRIIDADTYAAFLEAYTNINKAIALDPNFARPYVGLFDLRASHQVLGLPPATPAELRTIVRKLEELAPNLAATHRAQSWISFYDLDFAQAEKRILQAIKADPKVDPSWYGFMLTHWGRPEEARKQLEIARSNTPALAIIYRRVGHTYYLERNYTNAIAWYRQALAWDRHHGPAALWMGRAYRAMHDFTNALDYLEEAHILLGENESETKGNYAELRHAFTELGERGYWAEEWRRTAKNMNNDFYSKALIQIHLGDTNAAFTWLNKSFDTRERKGVESPLVYLLFNECWDGLHDDPRFKDLLDKTGFTKIMPKRKK